jgi:beta-lactam-binding protein with PASTA domain
MMKSMDDFNDPTDPTDAQTVRRPRRSAVIAFAALSVLALILIVALLVRSHGDKPAKAKHATPATTTSTTETTATVIGVKPGPLVTTHGIVKAAPFVLPDLTGQQFTAAKTQMEHAGLKVSQTSAGDTGMPPGTVAHQSPKAGATLHAGDKVQLAVSSKPAHPPVVVPPVIGRSAADAVKELAKQDLKAQQVKTTSALPKGQVIAQKPTPGTPAKGGDTVTLTVSSGAKTIVIPQLIGKQATIAAAELSKLGLAVSRTLQSVPKGSPLAGKVISQSPPAGAKAPASSSVLLTIGSATAEAATTQVRVPNVTGKTETEARAIIQQAGLRSNVQVSSTTPTAARTGSVTYQSPPEGQVVARGTQVMIIVYRP